MGVVRREGGWRLEKRGEGEYEITFERKPEERILTPEYSADHMSGFDPSPIPVHRVDSYAEAEGLFEERAHSSQAGGFGSPTIPGANSHTSSDPIRRDIGSMDGLEDVDLEDAPPGIVAIGFIVAGVVILFTFDFDLGSLSVLFGIGSVIFGFGIIGYVFHQSQGLSDAVSKFFTSPESESKTSDDEIEKVPPAPQKLKDELYFDRAEQNCEWCDKHTDNPEVHHVVPRSEGGSNERSNLIVLCPNHHRLADSGGISQTKLKSKLRRIERE